MIINPQNWQYIYTEPTLEEIESALFKAVSSARCPNLCLSGGIDSSLTLHFMSQLYPSVTCFTIASSESHPDYYYSKLIAEKYNAKHLIYMPTPQEITSAELPEDLEGDVAVRLLYKFITNYADEVVSSDCIDELDCGYYPHQQNPTDPTFRSFIKELEHNHLKPLGKNSGTTKVHLPYASKEVVDLFFRLPLSTKVDQTTRKKHIVAIASKYLPTELILRRKYGFCSALRQIS